MKHKMNPILDAQLNRNRSRNAFNGGNSKAHRRNFSDPKFSTSLTDSYNADDVIDVSICKRYSKKNILFDKVNLVFWI